jgi:hypothetical protein
MSFPGAHYNLLYIPKREQDCGAAITIMCSESWEMPTCRLWRQAGGQKVGFSVQKLIVKTMLWRETTHPDNNLPVVGVLSVSMNLW